MSVIYSLSNNDLTNSQMFLPYPKAAAAAAEAASGGWVIMSSTLISPPAPYAPTRLPRTATRATTPARVLLRRNHNTLSESSSTIKMTCSAAEPQLDLDGNPTLPISRRELIGQILGLGFGLVCIQSATAAVESPCDLIVAPSGLAYCDRIIGTGPQAVKGQLIKAHYVGKLDNGKVFDSSYNRGKPLTFRVGVGEVIKGWDEGILGGDGIPPMLAGGKRTLKLPPELGYGMRGAGCRGGSCIIPPSSVLLFDVEFIGN